MTKEQHKKRKALGIWSYDFGVKPGPKIPPPVSPKKAKVGTIPEENETHTPHDDVKSPYYMPATITNSHTAVNSTTPDVANDKAVANDNHISQYQLVTEVNKSSQVTFNQSSKHKPMEGWRSPEGDDSGRSSRTASSSPNRRLFTHVTANRQDRPRQGSAKPSRQDRKAEPATGRPKSSFHKENSSLPKKNGDKNPRKSANL